MNCRAFLLFLSLITLSLTGTMRAANISGKVIVWGMSNDQIMNVPPAAQSGVKAISAGAFFALALKTNGPVLAWGDNTFGELCGVWQRRERSDRDCCGK